MDPTQAQHRRNRKYRTAVSVAAAIFVAATAALGAALVVPQVTDAAVRLGVDGSWWLWAAGLAAGTALGYGSLNVWQKQVFAKLSAVQASAKVSG